MTFSQMYLRRKAAEEPGLKTYVDKIELKQRLLSAGLPILDLFFMSRSSPADAMPLVNSLTRYVAKVSHRDGSFGVFVVDNGRDLRSGESITPSQVIDGLQKAW